MNKKLFIFDLDGTLLNDDRQIVPATLATLNRVLDMGHKVVICTGRSFSQLTNYIKQIPKLSAVASMNGCIVNNLETKQKELIAEPIKREVIDALLALAQEYKRELHWCSEDEFHRVYFGTTPEQDIKDKTFFMMGTPNPTYEAWEVAKQHFNIPILHIAMKTEASLLNEPYKKLYDRFHNQAEIVKTGEVYIDVNAPGVNKFAAVKIIQKMFEISNADTYCFGDSDNDISMIKQAGHGVCLSNGTPGVKKIARHIIGDNNSNTISDFINEVLAGKHAA